MSIPTQLSHGPAVPGNGNSVSDKVSPRGNTDPTKLAGLKITTTNEMH